MQTLTQLADAARAVIAADRAGELTDEMINSLELSLKRAETPRGCGPYGVDAGYFDRKLARILPVLDNYKPADLAREFARMAAVADRDAARAELLPATEQSGEAVTQPCWSCKKPVSIAQRADSDGNCPNCNSELDDDWPATVAPQPAQQIHAWFRRDNEFFGPWIECLPHDDGAVLFTAQEPQEGGAA